MFCSPVPGSILRDPARQPREFQGRGKEVKHNPRRLKRFRSLLPGMAVALALLLGACSYTVYSTQGIKVQSGQIEKIKLGRTTEMEVLNLLGPPTKKERVLGGGQRLLYESTDINSLTFPGGYQARGFLDKEEDEIFEVILKDGIVETYRYLKP